MNLQTQNALHSLAGGIPGQRFLLPVSFVACVPSARWLSRRLSVDPERWKPWTVVVAFTLFVSCFWTLSAAHESYLRAHATIQQEVNAYIPAGADVVVLSELATQFGGCKEFAPVYKTWNCVELDPGHVTDQVQHGAYLMWVGAPGSQAPNRWFDGHRYQIVQARSWIWNADVWLAFPKT
jgi:hypothetical protein